jgi:uncharacterized DUF497 family protein
MREKPYVIWLNMASPLKPLKRYSMTRCTSACPTRTLMAIRWRTVGRVGMNTLFVVHTLRDEHSPGRNISARKATMPERKAYEEDA